MRLAYSREAVADLARLRQFIAEKDPAAETRIAESLPVRIGHLSQCPHMGVAVQQAPPPADIRDMVFGNDVVRHSVHDDALAILRIWHHYEDRSRRR